MGITTVFGERLAPPDLVDTLANDAGVSTAVLDPIEGLTDETEDEDYLTLMSREPRRAPHGERLPVTDPVVLSDGAVAIDGRPVLRGLDLDRPLGRLPRADGRQRLGQVDAGPGPDRPAAR